VTKATTFVGDVSDLVKTYGPERIFNTDQSGFNAEYLAGRTLDIQGQKSVFAEAQSINALTQLYYSAHPIR